MDYKHLKLFINKMDDLMLSLRPCLKMLCKHDADIVTHSLKARYNVDTTVTNNKGVYTITIKALD